VPLSAEDVKTLEGMVAQFETSGGAKPSVGQLVSVIVRTHLQGLKVALNSEAAAEMVEPGPASSVSKASLQKMIEDQIRPLREQVRRLENELHTAGK
jgi:hypothetical protein